MLLTIIISHVGTRWTPGKIDGNSFCATIPFIFIAMAPRIALCIFAGKRSKIRPIVDGAVDAWIVPKTKWPVSAA